MKTQGSINLKSPEEIKTLHEAGKILAAIIDELKGSVLAGKTTLEIDQVVEDLIKRRAVKAAFKGYRGFPGSACISINEEIVHGIPGRRKIKDGDIVSVDVGIIYEGFYSDTAITVAIGQIDKRLKELLSVTEAALYKGIEQAVIGNHVSDISHAVQRHVEAHGFSVVREFVGHGIGRNLHEEPEIPNFGAPHKGPVLAEGMVFAIEPMVNVGGWQAKILEDGWTVVTQDKKPSAHFEHTIAVTKKGPLILTAK